MRVFMGVVILAAPEYPQFLAALKASIRQRQYQALRAVNHELLAFIGKLAKPFITSKKNGAGARLWWKPWPGSVSMTLLHVAELI